MKQINISRKGLLIGLLGIFVVLIGLNVYIAASQYDGGSFVQRSSKSDSPDFLRREVLIANTKVDDFTKIMALTEWKSEMVCLLRTYQLRPRDEDYEEATYSVYNYVVQNQDFIGEAQWGLYFMDGQTVTPAKYANAPDLMLWPDTPLPAYIIKAMPPQFVRHACAPTKRAGFYKFNMSDVSYLVFGIIED